MTQKDFFIPLSVGNSSVTATTASNLYDIAVANIVLEALCFVIITASFVVQFFKPANYGKFDQSKETKDSTTGTRAATPSPEEEPSSSSCKITQRIAHILSDFPPGVLLFTIIFFTVAKFDDTAAGAASSSSSSHRRSSPSFVMLALWLGHYIHRGLIHPLCMRYSSQTVDLGICLGGFFPNCLFATSVALHVSTIWYDDDYFKDARFIVGVILFAFGYAANRWADFHLRSLREEGGGGGGAGGAPAAAAGDALLSANGVLRKGKYALPTAGLFSLCYQPNYLGEFVQWVGFAILTSSLPGVLWALFGLSTFLPRALAAKKWYIATFGEEHAPTSKAALIPFII